ncbi:MAG: hypothetical protein KGL42_08705 [Betaproteobacteria bacterium]|nr:hypothetical protein [Betaproteobacteria bacterium]
MSLLVVQPGTPSGNSSGVSSRTFSLTGVTAGNSLVVQFNCESQNTNDPIVFPAGWTVKQAFTPTGYSSAVIAVLNNATAGTNSVTVHFASGTSGGYYYGLMSEVLPLAASPGDLYDTATATGGTLTPTSGATATSQADEIVFSVISPDLNVLAGTVSQTTPSGYTSIYNEKDANSYQTGASAYKVLSATQAISAAWTALTTDSDGWAALIWSLKGATPSTNTVTAAPSVNPIASSTVAQAQPVKSALSVAPGVAATIAAALVVQAIASVTPGVTASVEQAQRVAVAASVFPGVSASVVQSQSVTARASVLSGVSGAVAQQQPVTAAASVTPGVAASVQAAGVNAVTTAVSVRPGVAAMVSQAQPVTATVSVTPSVAGSVQPAGVNVVTAAASVIPGVTATLHGAQPVSAVASVRPGVSAAVQGAQAVQASLSVVPGVSATVTQGTLPVTAYVSVVPGVNASIGQRQPVVLAASVVPSAAARVSNGNPYTTTPQFYVRMPARSFTLSMPARGFYVAMPARSFYLQDTESMPAQTFPDAMDPAETQTLTIDKTPDLGANETLVALVGQPIITVSRGTDAQPSGRFGIPAINVAQIAADLPAIPTAIAIGKGAQLVCTQPADGCWYLFRQPCTTSTGRVVTLKFILQSTAS